MVVWIIGLSGAGKTTIGRGIYSHIKKRYPNTIFLDGDEIRKIFQSDKGSCNYTIEGRKINAQRIVSLCKMLDLQGIHVVCSTLCIFPEMLEQNRNLFGEYVEIYVDAPIEILQQRDEKGLYKAASLGKEQNVVGIDIKFPVPNNPDLILDTSNPDNLQNNIDLAIGIITKNG